MTSAVNGLTTTLLPLLILCLVDLCDGLFKPGECDLSLWKHLEGEEDVWVFHSGGNTSSMDGSQAICQSMDANLLTIKTPEKSQDVFEWLKNATTDVCELKTWLGIRSHSNETSKWVDATYLGPKDYHRFNETKAGCYTKVWCGKQSKYWKHEDCEKEIGFICESEGPCSPKPVFLYDAIEWRENTTASISITGDDLLHCKAVGDLEQVSKVVLQCDGMDGQKSDAVMTHITVTEELNEKHCCCRVRLKKGSDGGGDEKVLRILFYINTVVSTTVEERTHENGRAAWAYQGYSNNRNDPWLYILIGSGLFFALTLLVFVIVFGKKVFTQDHHEQSLDKSEAASPDTSSQSTVSEVENAWGYPPSEEEEEHVGGL